MYSLTIHFGPQMMVWSLLFKDESNAGKVYNEYVGHRLAGDAGMLLGADDFGQSFAIPIDGINGVLLEDLDLVEQARIERSLYDGRAQVKFNERAKTDPVLRAGMAQRGPAVLQPGFRN